MTSQKEVWHIEGEYFESCNCEVLCPCLLTGGRPTEGHCDVVLAFHIVKGGYGSVDLADLNAVQALTTPGVMAAGNGTLAVYLDSRADAEQRAALDEIFSGRAGGPPSLFGPIISTRLPTKSAPITFASEGTSRKVSIANIASVSVDGIAGAGKQVVWLENIAHPYSTRLAAAKGTTSQYRDHNLVFENSGRNAHFSHIDWSNA
jgi:hypothetical protein